MPEVVVSLRVDKKLHEQMKVHDEINWSAVMRKSILESIEKMEEIDVKRSKEASLKIDTIRKLKKFAHGKASAELIREWRDKRKL